MIPLRKAQPATHYSPTTQHEPPTPATRTVTRIAPSSSTTIIPPSLASPYLKRGVAINRGVELGAVGQQGPRVCKTHDKSPQATNNGVDAMRKNTAHHRYSLTYSASPACPQWRSCRQTTITTTKTTAATNMTGKKENNVCVSCTAVGPGLRRVRERGQSWEWAPERR